MGLLYEGMRCSLCREELDPDGAFFATTCTDLGDVALTRQTDAAIHWGCYAAWKQQPRFARAYFRAWVDWDDKDARWHRAFLDPDLQVLLDTRCREVRVSLAATGTHDHRVPLQDWETWLRVSEPQPHPLLANALSDAKRRLRRHLPTALAVIGAVRWDRKRPLIEAEAERQREGHRQQERYARKVARRERLGKAAHNAEVQAVADRVRVAGMTCPYCQETTTRIRVAHAKRKWHELHCLLCDARFDPGDPGPEA